jgi:hypothetical protein
MSTVLCVFNFASYFYCLKTVDSHCLRSPAKGIVLFNPRGPNHKFRFSRVVKRYLSQSALAFFLKSADPRRLQLGLPSVARSNIHHAPNSTTPFPTDVFFAKTDFQNIILAERTIKQNIAETKAMRFYGKAMWFYGMSCICVRA